jgi:transposase
MPRQRLFMRKIEEVLRLKWGAGLSPRQIAKAVGIGRTTVSDYIARAEAAGISWPLRAGMDAAQLGQRVFSSPGQATKFAPAQPDFAAVHRELCRKGVTLFLLWQEYRERYPEACSYSCFCERYSAWKGQLDVVMRQSQRAGEKLFVDDAGQTVEVVDPTSGEIRAAQIFVAVLGASNYTYAEATWSQGLADSGLARMCALWPSLLVCLKSSCRTICAAPSAKRGGCEPDLNPSYQDFAAHYGVAVIPARGHKPRDKAKAEGGVLLVERWILARLRRQTFAARHGERSEGA